MILQIKQDKKNLECKQRKSALNVNFLITQGSSKSSKEVQRKEGGSSVCSAGWRLWAGHVGERQARKAKHWAELVNCCRLIPWNLRTEETNTQLWKCPQVKEEQIHSCVAICTQREMSLCPQWSVEAPGIQQISGKGMNGPKVKIHTSNLE